MNEISIDNVDQITHLIPTIKWLLLSLFPITVGFILRDIIIDAINGFMFYFDVNFMEGDIVYMGLPHLEKKEYIIVKIGKFKSVFQCQTTKRFMYMKNDKLRIQDMEKNPNKECITKNELIELKRVFNKMNSIKRIK